MNDFVTRARNALERITANAEESRHINGLLGRLNPDGSTTFTPVGLPRHKFVRIRNSSGSQTTIVARDDAGVPESSGLAVRLRVIHSVPNSGVVVYAIAGIVRDDALATMPAPPPGGVPPHIHDERYFREDEFINVSVGAADAAKPVVLDAGGQLDASFIDSEDIADIVGTMVTGNTETDIAVTYQDADNTLDFVVSSTLVADRITAAATDDSIADADLWGYVTGGVLVKTAWSNIKAVFKTYFDTLYVALTGDQTIAGNKTFTDNLAIASIDTSGNSLNVTRNLTATSTDAPVVSIVQDHTGDDQTALRVQQDGTGAIANFFAAAASIFSVGATDATIGKWLTLTTANATIAGGVITATGSLMIVDTEAAAATDDLDTINGGAEGRILLMRTTNGTRDVTLKHGTGNIRLPGSTDFTLNNRRTFVIGYYNAAEAVWVFETWLIG